MIDSSADVKGQPSHIDATSQFRSSVFVVARDPWRGVLDLLLKRKGDVNAVNDYGDGPLHIAVCHSGSTDSDQQLLDHGADVDKEDGDGVPAALHLAIQGRASQFALTMGLQLGTYQSEADEMSEDDDDLSEVGDDGLA